jgi:hypothetical protein
MPNVRFRRSIGWAVAALSAVPASAGASPPPGSYGARLGSHSMVYLNTAPAHQEAMFRATAEAGVRYLRMDFAIGLVFAPDRTDFSAVDRVNALAARYDVDVLGVLTTTPWYIAECPGGSTEHLERCGPAPRHEGTWRDMVSSVARRASNVRRWELGNEPDNGFGFTGGPADYARWAALAAEGIRAARPNARIAVGGFSHLDRSFIAAVLHDPAHPLLGRIDIANIHARGSLRSMRRAVGKAKAFYRRMGFRGSLWVTETGYPSLPERQWDPALRDGLMDQARWIARGPKRLVDGGADAVFVTFRDGPEFGAASPFSSEGILLWPELGPDGRARPKPAFWALQRLAARVRPRARSAGDGAALEGPADELGALAVLRHLGDLEPLEQRL